MSRLGSGDLLLMDGGTGSEIQRRGVNVSRGWTPSGNIGPWSAIALGTAPEVVRQVHEDYLRAGADIIITNSFYSNPSRMGTAVLSDRWEEYTRTAGRLACEARDKVNPDAFVAGGIAPPGVRGSDLSRELAGQAEVLAEAGVDLVLPEYVGSVEDCVAAVDAVSGVGLPVFLGVKHVDRFLIAPEELVQALEGHRVDAILAMCSRPEQISATLPGLRQAFHGPIGAYANIGYGAAQQSGDDPEKQLRVIDIGGYTPERYAEFGRQWLEIGAQIVGGCCATGPEHIAALRPVVKG